MGDVKTDLALSIRKFRESMQRASRGLAAFMARVATAGRAMGAKLFGGLQRAAALAGGVLRGAMTTIAATSAVVGAAMAYGLKKAFDLGGRLSDIASTLGTTAGQVLLLGEAFRQAGVSAERLPDAIGRMSRGIVDAVNIGSETTLEPFRALKVKPEDLIDKSASEAFQVIGAAINAVQDPLQKLARARQIFGRAGGELLPLFEDAEALDKAAQMLGKQTSVMDSSAADFDRASDILGGAWIKLQGFFVGLGAELVKHILPILESLNKIDLTEIGQRFGRSLLHAVNVMASTFQAFTKSDMLNVVGDVLILATKKWLNYQWRLTVAIFKAAGQSFIEVGVAFIDMLGVLVTADFWKGMWEALKAIGNSFRALLLETLAELIEGAKEIPGFGVLLGDSEQALRQSAAEIRARSDAQSDRAADYLAPAYQRATDRMAAGFENTASAFRAAFAETRDLIDETKQLKRLEAAHARVAAQMEANRLAAEEAIANSDAGKPEDAKPTITQAIEAAREQATGVGRFASAINVLAGRSAQALLADEARRHTGLLQEIAGTLSDIKSTGPPKIATRTQPIPEPVFG